MSRTFKILNKITGGLSKPSKMPGHAFSISAQRCITGGKLRDVEGSVCRNCYACGGRYLFDKTVNAMERRYQTLMSSPTEWVDAMVESINKRADKEPYFRWHDSGDIQSTEHLDMICQVARGTPTVSHWVPTREYSIVKKYLANGNNIPPNLNVRLSAHMIDGPAPSGLGLPTSTVIDSGNVTGQPCPAPSQGGECGDCRACWDSSVENVTYHIH